jgi:SAM-dependent MidA family methyltransferase
MTPLGLRLRRMIEAGGPMPVSAWMALCLGDPEHGYYMARDPFGPDGDFTTAPEISQLFGEMIGVHFALAAKVSALEGAVTLAECGPGRGTLMRDMLRTLKRVAPQLRPRVMLVETSARLRDIQRGALAGMAEPEFLDTPDALPVTRPLLLVANEFLDALPFRQFIKRGGVWRERMVDVAGDAFAFVPGTASISPADLPPGATLQPDGAIFELAPAREAAVATLAEHVRQAGGAALLIDYGHVESGFGDTFQAMRDHAFADVLAEPGLADLTSHVDFAPLLAAARRAGCVAATMEQGDFLIGLGLLERAGALGAAHDEATRERIRQAVARLAGPEAMGRLFKVLALAAAAPLAPPFAPAG